MMLQPSANEPLQPVTTTNTTPNITITTTTQDRATQKAPSPFRHCHPPKRNKQAATVHNPVAQPAQKHNFAQYPPFNYMTQAPTETPDQPPRDRSPAPAHSLQHGSLLRDGQARSGESSVHHGVYEGFDASLLDRRLYGLSGVERGDDEAAAPPPPPPSFSFPSYPHAHATPGQRVIEYENALAPQAPKQELGLLALTPSDSSSEGIQLEDLPNEILTHVFSHLPPDSYLSVALVSKRFWALVTTHHAWRMAFVRYFPGHTALGGQLRMADGTGPWAAGSASVVARSEIRYFPRLSLLATWRSEYLFRTRRLGNLARGKPGTPAGLGGRPGKKGSAVLTYTAAMLWNVTHLHATFSNGRKPPRAIHGSAHRGTATLSDPTTGRIEKWGQEDLYLARQFEEVETGLVPYGLGEGPAAAPNVMDVSQLYGVIAGEGFPGGRPQYRGVKELLGRYLGADGSPHEDAPDIPKIPDMFDCVCSVWIAKSSAVTATTRSMFGILTGSALGVVTAYSLGWDTTHPRYTDGDMTARWVLSPGVPIVALKVDDHYSQKRKLSSRVWAVALNALGEVYYLTEAPQGRPIRDPVRESRAQNAWYAGRTVHWHLLDATRRVAREGDRLGNDVSNGACSPRSSSDAAKLSYDQLVAEAREIEKFFRHKPSHFRKTCKHWDMRCKLEVDFANDDGKWAGESIFVINCGFADDHPASIQKYTRYLASQQPKKSVSDLPEPFSAKIQHTPSLYGAVEPLSKQPSQVVESQVPLSPPPTPTSPPDAMIIPHDWGSQTLQLGVCSGEMLTVVAMDDSAPSLVILAEDPLHIANEGAESSDRQAQRREREIPGRRARFILAGTNTGVVFVWNARDAASSGQSQPLRVIQTDSPEISALAATGLYVVSGGSDGLIQAWDPLCSTMEPIRTINAKWNGRGPHVTNAMNHPVPRNFHAVGAIQLDPDPMVLQGIASFGGFVRYWSYSSKAAVTSRKRRARHSTVDGRLASRRYSNAVMDFIEAEECELYRQNDQRAREQSRIHRRFGALDDLTEEEAILYAQMVSEEAHATEELPRASDLTADFGLDTASSLSENTLETLTPDPSVAGPSASASRRPTNEEMEYEQQIQQAIRLSLMEGVNEDGPSSQGDATSNDRDFTIKYKPRNDKRVRHSASSSPSASYTPVGAAAGASSHRSATTEDEDLALALSLSMQDLELDHNHDQGGGYSPTDGVGLGIELDEFPSLPNESSRKGKGVMR